MAYLVETLDSLEQFTDREEALERFFELVEAAELQHNGLEYAKQMLKSNGQFTLNSVTRWIRISEI
jgi:hypothetical protein